MVGDVVEVWSGAIWTHSGKDNGYQLLPSPFCISHDQTAESLHVLSFTIFVPISLKTTLTDQWRSAGQQGQITGVHYKTGVQIQALCQEEKGKEMFFSSKKVNTLFHLLKGQFTQKLIKNSLSH